MYYRVIFCGVVVTSSLSLRNRPSRSEINGKSLSLESSEDNDYTVCDNQECEDVGEAIFQIIYLFLQKFRIFQIFI